MHVASSRPRSVSSAILRAILTTVLSLAGLAAVRAQSPDILVGDAWARMAPNNRNGAVFMTIESRRTADASIVSASSPAARVVELHEMAMQGDVMRMRKVEQIAVPAGGRVELKPGGLHVMLIDLVKPLAAGETVSLTLKLADGTEIAVSAPVRVMGGH